MMLPQFFTTGEMLKIFGHDPENARNPRLTGELYRLLRRQGYTQRMIHHGGRVQRVWSKHWAANKNKEIRRKNDKGEETRWMQIYNDVVQKLSQC